MNLALRTFLHGFDDHWKSFAAEDLWTWRYSRRANNSPFALATASPDAPPKLRSVDMALEHVPATVARFNEQKATSGPRQTAWHRRTEILNPEGFAAPDKRRSSPRPRGRG
jgi:hypothetical protein